MAEARTIELLLSNGTLNGLLRAELAKWNGVMFSSPRDSYSLLSNQFESKYWGIYLLLSDDKVYIGQANELLRRISEHDRGKDWWTRVVLMTTTNDSLTRSDIDWLEYKLINIAFTRGTLDVDNRVKGNTPKVSVFREANLSDYLDGALLLLELVGIKVFAGKNKARKYAPLPNDFGDKLAGERTPIIAKPNNKIRDIRKLFGLTIHLERTSNDRGFSNSVLVVSEREFILKSGSLIKKQDNSIMWKDKKDIAEIREYQSKVGKLYGDRVVQDILFDSLNKVARFIYGQNINAWVSFVDSSGVTIDAIAKS